MIEVVTILVLFSAAMAMSLSILNQLVTITQKTTAHCVVSREIARLAVLLRDDCHRCEKASVTDDGQKLCLIFRDGRSHDYEWNDQGLSFRSVRSAGDVSAGTKESVDRFLVTPFQETRFIQNDDDGMVSLLIRNDSPRRPRIQIDAAIAIDQPEEVTLEETP